MKPRGARRRIRGDFAQCTRPGVALVLLASLIAGRQSPAWADDANAGKVTTVDERRTLAKSKFEQGVEAYRNERYVDAVRLFLAADALSPSVALSFDIGHAYEKIGDDAATLRWYRNYLRLKPDAANRAEVTESIKKLSKVLADKGIQQLTVLSTPPGATVAIDGQAVGVTPLTIELGPGDHAASLTARGYHDTERAFRLEALTPLDLAFELRPAASAPAPAEAPVTSAKNAGRRFGIAPLVTIGAGVLALGGSIAFEVARSSAENAARNQREQLSFERDVDAMNSRQTTSRVLLGVGGVLIATGATLLVFNTRVSPDSRAVVSSMPGGAKLSLSQSF